MSQHKEILRLIETVDPKDTAKLDEIDARVHEYLGEFKWWKSKHNCYNLDIKGEYGSKQYPYHQAYSGYCPETGKKKKFPEEFPYASVRYEIGCPSYTISRDALKAIRPEGWCPGVWVYCGGSRCIISGYPQGQLIECDSGICKNEELAELHAIIQAIAHERGEG